MKIMCKDEPIADLNALSSIDVKYILSFFPNGILFDESNHALGYVENAKQELQETSNMELQPLLSHSHETLDISTCCSDSFMKNCDFSALKQLLLRFDILKQAIGHEIFDELKSYVGFTNKVGNKISLTNENEISIKNFLGGSIPLNRTKPVTSDEVLRNIQYALIPNEKLLYPKSEASQPTEKHPDKKKCCVIM